MPQLVAAQIFRWMADADFGVVNYLIDKMPGVDYQNHSWFVDPIQGWIVITTLVVWAGIPFLAITLNAGLTQVPKELVEAATVDGANAWQALRNITLPILKPLLDHRHHAVGDLELRPVHPELGAARRPSGAGLPDAGDLLVHAGVRTVQVQPGLGHRGDHRAAACSGVMAFYIRQMFKIGEVD